MQGMMKKMGGSMQGMMKRQMGGTMAMEGMMGMMGGGMEAGDWKSVEYQNRLYIAQLSSALAASEQNPKNAALLKELDEPLTMAFAKPTPLEDVLKYIKSATAKAGRAPLPIYVDPLPLKEAELTMASPVVIDLEGVPLKTALRLILKQLGLAYCVRDGVVIVSSPEGIRQELAEAATELMGNDPDQLSGIMQSMHSQMKRRAPQ
jgi:hypothetical protein